MNHQDFINRARKIRSLAFSKFSSCRSNDEIDVTKNSILAQPSVQDLKGEPEKLE
jgi:hypothetical protein